MEWLVFLVGLVLLIAAPAIVVAPFLMYLSQTLTFFQSFRILAAGFAVIALISVVGAMSSRPQRSACQRWSALASQAR